MSNQKEREEKYKKNMERWEFIAPLSEEEFCKRSKKKYYPSIYGVYKCRICGEERVFKKDNFYGHDSYCKNGCHGLPKCTRYVVQGMNDVASTHPHVVKYLKNKEDAKKSSYGSRKKVEIICPTCKNEDIRILAHLCKSPFVCSYCSDGFSYPEKFIRSLLSELKIKYIPQFRIEGRRRYDFFLPTLNLIFEVHGKQHYERGFKDMGGRTLEQEQENDKLKEEMAIDNGYEYFALDCRNSSPIYIIEKLKESPLSEYIKELDNTVWEKVAKDAESNISIQVIEKWNKTKYTEKQLAKKFNVTIPTIVNYLKRGEEMGLCTYIKRDTSPTKTKRNKRSRRKEEVVLVKNGEIIHIAKNRKDMSDYLNGYPESTIKECCEGRGLKGKKTHHVNSKKFGMMYFYYKQDYENYTD